MTGSRMTRITPQPSPCASDGWRSRWVTQPTVPMTPAATQINAPDAP